MTLVTATPAPGPDTGPGADPRAEVVTLADLSVLERQLASSGACSHPVRLRGRIDAVDRATGEIAPVYDTTSEPGGVLHVACGNRRETRCPACSAIYKRDARQLVRAGLTGGKGVPESVAAHPCVFATLTAPSFGPVHARRMRGKTVLPCRPRRDADKRVCPHGRDISCPVRHSEHDPRLGRPMCPDCYDYEAAVLFNLHATALWRRFTTYLPRHLARVAGVTGKRLDAELAIRFVKVAEYQARGVIHFHAVIRLDANTKEGFTPPPVRYTTPLLCDAIALAAKAARITVPGSGPGIRVRFGRELDKRPIWRQSFAATGRALDPIAVANYIAKYVTKAVDVPGLPDTRIRHVSEIDALRCPAHHKRMVAMAWDSAQGHRSVILGCGCGRTNSGSAATRSPNRAATPSPSATSGASASPRGGSSATPRVNVTRGAVPSMTAWSWSWPTGATPEPATPPAHPTQSWRGRRPTWHAATEQPPH